MSNKTPSTRHLLIGGAVFAAVALLAVTNISSGTPVSESSTDTLGSISAEVLPDAVRPTYRDEHGIEYYTDNDRLTLEGDNDDLPAWLREEEGL